MKTCVFFERERNGDEEQKSGSGGGEDMGIDLYTHSHFF